MIKDRPRRSALFVLAAILAGTLTACPGQDEGTPALGSKQPARPDAEDIRYVSPDGRDRSPGTRHRPWRTLTRALPSLLPGQLLLVRGGSYDERVAQLDLHEARKKKPITVRALPGEEPVVRGTVWLHRPDYWTFEGINVTWAPGISPPPRHMVKITDGVGWTWRDSEIWGAHSVSNVLITGTRRGEPAGWSFTGNCVHDLKPRIGVQQGSNVTVGEMEGAGPGRITRNVIFDHDLRGRNIRLGSRGSGPTDVTVDYNTLYAASVAIALTGTTSGTRIERNVMGGPSSGTLVRVTRLRAKDNEIQQNLGVEAQQFHRPHAVGLHVGPGNILSGNVFRHRTLGCDDFTRLGEMTATGFQPSTLASAYGRYALW